MDLPKQFIITYFAFSPVEYDPSIIDHSFKAGINLLPTYTFDPSKHSLERFRSYLEEANKKSLPVLIYDARIGYKALEERGEEKYREGIKESLQTISEFPNVVGYFLGDEPWEKDFPFLIRSNQILLEEAPHLNNYVNLYPYFDSEKRHDIYNFKMEKYPQIAANLLKEAKISFWGMDHYGFLWRNNQEKGLTEFFKTIAIMKEVGSLTDSKPLWAGCSVGHFQIDQPSFDDFRYQISIAYMSGFLGVSWYKFVDTGYGLSILFDGVEGEFPVALNNQTTIAYQQLSLASLWFQRKFAAYQNLTYLSSSQINFPDHELPEFQPDDTLEKLTVWTETPVLVSLFHNEKGEKIYFVMNLSRKEPLSISYEFSPSSIYRKGSCWLEPGEMTIISHEK